MKLLSTLMLLLLTSELIFSNTYYVSNSGSNLNDGLSPGTAFLTLQHASDVVVAGDMVVVMPGTYAAFYHTTSGTVNNRITFQAQPGVLINTPNAITGDGINLEGASFIFIRGFNIYGMPRAGLRSVSNEGISFRDNRIDSCGKWGILTGFSEGINIENNECSRSVDEHGIYVSNSADHPFILGNHCWGNNANGIHMNGDINMQPGDGIISFARVANNIIHDNGIAGGSGINCDGVQYSVIWNNLLYNNHGSGISLYRIDGGGGSINNLVVNNTIVQPTVTRWALNISDGSTGNKAFNNILYSDHSFRGSVSIDASSMPGFYCDYNTHCDRMSADGGNTVMSFAQWQSTTLLDSHSVVASPAQLFQNFPANDYHLSASSPARNNGTPGPLPIPDAPSIDLDSIHRPQGNQYDIGAYEFPEPSTSIEEVNAVTFWNELSPDCTVLLFSNDGKLVFSGKKKAAKGKVREIGIKARLVFYGIDSGRVVKGRVNEEE